MRTVLILCSALLAAPAFSQATPEAFLALVPPLPTVITTVKPADRAAFEGKVNRALDTMEQQLRLKRQRDEKEGKASNEAMEARVTGGRKGPSKAELARVDQMSDQEKIAWAMAQAKNMDPAAMQEMATRGQATQKAVNLPPDAKERIARIGRLKGRYEALDAEFNALAGGGGRGPSAAVRVIPPKLSERFAASYVALLAEHLAAIKAALPDFKRQAQLMAEAAGLPKATAESTDAMAEVKAYTARLPGVFKFNNSMY